MTDPAGSALVALVLPFALALAGGGLARLADRAWLGGALACVGIAAGWITALRPPDWPPATAIDRIALAAVALAVAGMLLDMARVRGRFAWPAVIVAALAAPLAAGQPAALRATAGGDGTDFAAWALVALLVGWPVGRTATTTSDGAPVMAALAAGVAGIAAGVGLLPLSVIAIAAGAAALGLALIPHRHDQGTSPGQAVALGGGVLVAGTATALVLARPVAVLPLALLLLVPLAPTVAERLPDMRLPLPRVLRVLAAGLLPAICAALLAWLLGGPVP